MSGVKRITDQVVAVAREFQKHAPEGRLYGYDIAKTTGFRAGTIGPILDRMKKAGWLVSEWEATEPWSAGRPRRKLFRMTELGERELADIAARGRSRQQAYSRGYEPNSGYYRVWLDRLERHGSLLLGGTNNFLDDGRIHRATARAFERRGFMRREGDRMWPTEAGREVLAQLKAQS